MRVINRVTRRDRAIAVDCYEHRVLTTEQLRRLHFTGERTTRARLNVLYELRVLDRFRPTWRQGDGSTPFHWILDEAGARIVAAELRVDRAELRWRRDVALRVASSSHLDHQVEVNDFFTTLAEQARNAGGALSEWYGERTGHQLLGGVVVPDGYGVLRLPEQPPAHLLLELDRGTEPRDRLREKVRRYKRALPSSQLAAENIALLFAFSTQARARWAHEALQLDATACRPLVWTNERHDQTLTIVQNALSCYPQRGDGSSGPQHEDAVHTR